MQQRLFVVTNAAAGSAGGEDAAIALLSGVADVVVAPCADPAQLGDLLDGRDGRRVLVAGGDGSVHTLVKTLHQRGELDPGDPVGILPLGTGNDLARTLGLPLDAREAAQAYLAGRPRVLDLVVDDRGGVVINAAHVGIGAEAARRSSQLKGALGPAAYAVGSVAAGLSSTGWELRVVVDGAVLHEGLALMAGIGNGQTIGGGAPFAPEAEPDDGFVDVIVSVATGPLQRAGYASDLREGDHVERPDVLTGRGRRVEVTGEDFPLNSDGELSGPHTAMAWTVRPRAWSVVVPSPAGSGP